MLPPSLPSFQPSDNDIRVNVLWFASLVVSLVTASFGMLVKQWLREFLAVENPSPQACLRLRHHREPELRKWKVYEMAAALPILLQLALGLFFAGLCYFTASAHRSIVYTIVPLVIGWAFFFFGVTLLPLFFPRCPYKTTLLKAPILRLHCAISRTADRFWRQYRLYHPRAQCTWWRRYLGDTRMFVIRRMRQISDEITVINGAAHDINILLSVDAIQASNELLATGISEAFQHIRPSWKEAVSFVMRVLMHRVPYVSQQDRILPAWPFRDPFPLDSLTPQAAEGVLRILSSYLGELRNPYSPSTHSFTQWSEERSTILCVSLLFISQAAVSIKLLPANAISFLRFYLTKHGRQVCDDLAKVILSSQSFASNSTDQTVPWENAARFLSGITNIASSLPEDLDTSKAMQWFANVQLSVLHHFHPDRPCSGLDWERWKLPEGATTSFKESSLEYLVDLALRDMRQVKTSPKQNASTTSLSVVVLKAALNTAIETTHDGYHPNRHKWFVWRNFQTMLSSAMERLDTARVMTDTLLAADYTNVTRMYTILQSLRSEPDFTVTSSKLSRIPF
jgi:hypothetical protein